MPATPLASNYKSTKPLLILRHAYRHSPSSLSGGGLSMSPSRPSCESLASIIRCQKVFRKYLRRVLNCSRTMQRIRLGMYSLFFLGAIFSGSLSVCCAATHIAISCSNSAGVKSFLLISKPFL